MRPVQSLDRERGEESLEIPGGPSTRLGQRTGGVRPQGMVHVFDAERVEIKYFSKECETGSGRLEPFFESGWWHQIVNHEVHTMPSEGPEVKQNLERLRTSAR